MPRKITPKIPKKFTRPGRKGDELAAKTFEALKPPATDIDWFKDGKTTKAGK